MSDNTKPYEQKPGFLSLFKTTQEKKNENPKRPDFFGGATIKPEDMDEITRNGGKVQLSGWLKIPDSGGEPFISGSIQPQRQSNTQAASPEQKTEFWNTPEIQAATSASEPVEQLPSDDLPF